MFSASPRVGEGAWERDAGGVGEGEGDLDTGGSGASSPAPESLLVSESSESLSDSSWRPSSELRSSSSPSSELRSSPTPSGRGHLERLGRSSRAPQTLTSSPSTA